LPDWLAAAGLGDGHSHGPLITIAAASGDPRYSRGGGLGIRTTSYGDDAAARAHWHLIDRYPHRTGIVMSRIQRIRHSPGVLAGLASARGAGEQVAGAGEQLAGDRCAAERRARDLAPAVWRFGVAVVLAASLFAGTANAIAATGPAEDASVVSGWNAMGPDTVSVPSLAGFPDGAAETGGAAFGERAAREVIGPRAPGLGSRRYPRAFIEWKLSARPPQPGRVQDVARTSAI
jgi:hypothetical protein